MNPAEVGISKKGCDSAPLAGCASMGQRKGSCSVAS